ncbi:MAG: aminotransferase class III-fold pyridoxal phosphate-dependent enzyme, partial [Rhodospirillales bacterium]|nr:aminotransferase class III-fold pyridoxal phosphate-dependent enzyme [Rhodospirillales bacterium]
GAELGCIVAMKVLEITQRPQVVSMVRYIADFIRAGLDGIRALYPDFFIGIRQHGVVMGLEFDHPQGAKPVMKHLYRNGVWAIFSTLDPRVLQFKPGILMSQAMCEETLARVEVAIGLAREEIMGKGSRRSR